MLSWFSFMVQTTVSYAMLIAFISVAGLPKLRLNLYAFFVRGQRVADLERDLSEEDKRNFERAKEICIERK